MPFYYNPLFVGLFLTSPIWLFALGTIIRVKCGNEDTKLGRTGIAMQFLAQINTVLILILAASGHSFWPAFFSIPVVFGWPVLLATCVIGIVWGKSKALQINEDDPEFGIGGYWGIFAALAVIIGLVVLVLYLLWQVLMFLYGLFLAISSQKG